MLYGLSNNLQYQEHFKRYNFARRFVAEKVVLDVGCGPHPGPEFFAEKAKRVVAIDISPEAIEYAKSHFSKENLRYLVMDATELKFPDESFEVVISLEVIEHIKDYRKYLSEIKRVIKPEGIYVFSTPNKKMMMNPNPSHIREFTIGELKELLEDYFKEIDLYGQARGKGIWGNTKEIILFLRRYDRLRLRKLFPGKFKVGVSKFLGRLTGEKGIEEITLFDFETSKNGIEKAEYFIGTCKKHA